jgi:hypothetical protein
MAYCKACKKFWNGYTVMYKPESQRNMRLPSKMKDCINKTTHNIKDFNEENE